MARIVPNNSAFRERNRFGNVTSALRLFEIARVLVRFNHVARLIAVMIFAGGTWYSLGKSKCKRHARVTNLPRTSTSPGECLYRCIIEKFRWLLNPGSVCRCLFRDGLPRHDSLLVIRLWRASTGYVGRGMLSIYHRSSNGTVTSAAIARA